MKTLILGAGYSGLAVATKMKPAPGLEALMVEQNARLALEAADRAYVMESGLITMTGPGQQLLNDPKVRAAYLGE